MKKKGRRYDEIDMPGLFDDLDSPFSASSPSSSAPQPAQPIATDDTPIYFMSFGSGSSGNCAYIGDGSRGFLIDAGVAPDVVFDTLLHNGITPEMVSGIIITHDHGDHVRYVYSYVRRYRHMMVYCTPKAFNGIMRRHSVSRRLRDYHRAIYKEFMFNIGEFEITPFEVSHDGSDNAGYYIRRGHHSFVVATDLGCITDRVDHYMRMANYIMLESNYDAEMLRNGTYPEYLKSRIVAFNGHLDNKVSAKFLADIYSPALRMVFLCHLSNDNNTPECAVREVSRALVEAHPDITIGDASNNIATRDADLQLLPLPRYQASPLFRFR